MTLEELIEAFQEDEADYTSWDLPRGAAGECEDASYQFAHFCAKQGAKAGLLSLRGPKFKTDAPGCSPGHYVVWVKDFERAVDWTGRQYRVATAYPLIQTLQEVKDEWEQLHNVKYINKEGYDYERTPA